MLTVLAFANQLLNLSSIQSNKYKTTDSDDPSSLYSGALTGGIIVLAHFLLTWKTKESTKVLLASAASVSKDRDEHP